MGCLRLVKNVTRDATYWYWPHHLPSRNTVGSIVQDNDTDLFDRSGFECERRVPKLSDNPDIIVRTVEVFRWGA